MRKKFLSSLFLILLLNLLIKPIYILGIDAEVQNRLGEEVYGNFFALLNFSFLLNIVNDLGLSNYFTRILSKNNKKVNPDFVAILGLRILMFTCYFGLTLILAGTFNLTSIEIQLLSILMLNQFFVAGIQYCRATFAGLLFFKTDAIISVLDRLLLIGICLYLLFGLDDFNIWWFALAQSLAYGLTFIIALILVFPKVNFKGRTKGIKAHLFTLKKSIPYALLVLLMMFYSRIDAIMVERIADNGDYQAGLYAQGFRFLDSANMFALLFAGILLPVFSNLLQKRKELLDLLKLGSKLLIGLGIVGAILGYYHAQDILAWRYGESASTASAISFGYLMLSFLPMCFTYLYGTLLTANGNLKHLNIMAGVALATNILLNYILIHKWGVEGAALATLITQCLAALIQFVLAYKIIQLKIEMRLIGSLGLLAALLIGGHLVLNTLLELEFPLLLSIETVLAGILVIALGIIKPKEITNLLATRSKDLPSNEEQGKSKE